MNIMYFVGMDVHKKFVQFCIKDTAGQIIDKGRVDARQEALERWAQKLPQPWAGAMEATMFTAWIHDVLLPFAARLEVGNPLLMKSIYAGKNKNDEMNAEQITDLLRWNLMPRVYVPTPDLRRLRDVMRFRQEVVRDMVNYKNRLSGLLMQHGVVYEQAKVHRKGYFAELRQQLATQLSPEVAALLDCSRGQVETLQQMSERLVRQLERDPRLAARVAHLQKIDGVGIITALTWALEVGDVQRLPSIAKAISYCGLCSADRRSAGQVKRGPLSKQRNARLQRVLIEAAHLAPQYNATLQAVFDQVSRTRNTKVATLAVARKLVAYLLAADRQFLQQQQQQDKTRVAAAGTVAA